MAGQCSIHNRDLDSVVVDYFVYSCPGAKRTCMKSVAFPAANGGSAGRSCVSCQAPYVRKATTSISIGYCAECLPAGLPAEMLPKFFPLPKI